MKISGVYKITNTATGDFYIGSSKNVKSRWANHKSKSTWKKHPNNPLYLNMQKYGLDKFDFQILEEVEPDSLKEREQWFIELLKPTYNSNRANGWDVDRYKEYQKEYHKSDKWKEYQKSDKCKKYQKEYMKEYQKSDKYKETQRKANNKYYNQLCLYNGEIITLNTLRARFRRSGIEHPTIEAKKYLLKKEPKKAIECYDVYP